MALIRQADIESNPRRALVLNVENIRAQADAIIDRTREAAAAIIAEAHAERARIVAGAAEAGRAQGHAEGLAAGLDEGRGLGRAEAFERAGAGLAALEASLRAALEGFGVEREALLRACESQALELALLLAERVTLRALAVDRESVVRQVGSLLEMATRHSRLVLSVHPADEAMVREAMPGLLAGDATARHVAVVPDGSLSPGSCIMRTPGGGVLDASVEARISAVIDEILPDRTPREGT